MLDYKIHALSKAKGEASFTANSEMVYFDSSAGRQPNLANPAELLLGSLAACILKNVERFSSILKYEYTTAQISITGLRNDNPPHISQIDYTLKVESNMAETKLNLLHKNILKHGTITNTLAKACRLNGTIEFLT